MKDREDVIKQYCKTGFKILFTNHLKESVTRSWKENTTSDYEVIKEHMTKYPEHNLAVYTGASNLIIIDIDMKNGVDGKENLKDFMEKHKLHFPETLSVKTPSGGRHLYYCYAKNDIRPRKGVISGVDVRCGDSYAIIPPSKIKDGMYEWEQEFVPENIAQVNEDVLWFCEYREPQKSLKKTNNKVKKDKIDKGQSTDSLPEVSKNKILPEEPIEEGSRNSELTALAGKLISQEMDGEEVEFYIKKANRERCNPPLPDNEVDSLIQSALRNFTSCKRAILELTEEEEIFLTDRFDIQKALEHLKRKVYLIQSDTEIEFKNGKENLTIYPCGTKKFNDMMISRMEEEKVKCSKLMWKAVKDKSILSVHKALELDTAVQNIIDIEAEDGGVIQIGGNTLYEMDNCYFVDTEKSTRQISNFTMKLNEQIEIVNDEGCVEGGEFEIEFILNSGKHYKKRVAPTIFSSVRKFKELIKNNSFELSYMGTETELEYIQQKMLRNTVSIVATTGINYTGFFKTADWNFVGVDKTIRSNGNENEELISVVEPTGSITTDILKQKLINPSDLQPLLLHLFGMNVTNKMIGVIGWCVAVFCKERLRAMNSKFPHLIVSGEAGSGKSSIVEQVIQPLFSIKAQPLSCEKMTQFSMLKACSSTNFLPVVMEEFKPGRLQITKLNLISSMLRDSYDFHGVRRGTLSQKVIHYQYRAPIVLVGEAGVSEKAINDRSLELLFSINERQQLHTNHFLWIKQHLSLLSELGRSLLDFTLKIEDKEIFHILEQRWDYFEKNTEFEDRNKLGLATVAMGMELLKRFAESQGIDFVTLTGIDEQKVLDSLTGIQLLASSDGEGKTMTEIEKTLEVWDSMAKQGILVEGVHYQKQVTSNELHLYIKEIYPLYSKYFRDCNLSMELDFIPKNQFTKQLKLTRYFKTHDKRAFQKVFIGNVVQVSNPKCFVLHLDILEKELEDLDKF